MTRNGTVEAIHIAPEAAAETTPVSNARLVAGRGIEGDRYYTADGTFSDHPGTGRDLTLIEAEAIEAVEREHDIQLSYADHRRNITTRDTPLNHLVDTTFRIGPVVCRGQRLCEPCSHLESLTADGVLSALVHRGGLRADILVTGTIRVGDPIRRL